MKVATIGSFDGVHKGHQFLISQVIGEAKKRDASSLVVTFSNHPRTVVSSDRTLQLLTTNEEKVSLLYKYGIDEVQSLMFTPQLASMSAYDFMKNVLHDEMGVDVLVIGYNHRFGHNREDGFEDYVRYGKEIGIEVVQAKAFEENFITVSSSLIRDSLLQGQVSKTKELLGYDYFIEGVVVDGFKVGRKIGYPTANVKVDPLKLIPCDGVYAVSAEIESKVYYGMLNIGFRPTFNNGKRSIEVNLFDFDSNIYSEHIRLNFIAHLRTEKKFASVDELVAQLALDEKKAREVIGNI